MTDVAEKLARAYFDESDAGEVDILAMRRALNAPPT
jgi:hypothetical protein